MDELDLTPVPNVILPKELTTALSVERADTDDKVTEADLVLANMQLNFLAECWLQVKSIGGVCKLIDATIKATKHRRDILKLPYGAPSKVSKTFEIPNLD